MAHGIEILICENLLEFIPVGEEEYDFAMRPETFELPEMKSFLRLLTSDGFKAELDRLGGYSTEHTGEVRRIYSSAPQS